jgi:hypothetical protein
MTPNQQCITFYINCQLSQLANYDQILFQAVDIAPASLGSRQRFDIVVTFVVLRVAPSARDEPLTSD